MSKKPIWIAGIARGHNAGVCLLKDGEIVFAIEEERLTRQKYDGGPYASMLKILDYTDKLDFLCIAHTQNLQRTAGRVDFSGDDVYTGLARKLGLIQRKQNDLLFNESDRIPFLLNSLVLSFLASFCDTLSLDEILLIRHSLNVIESFFPFRIQFQNQPNYSV